MSSTTTATAPPQHTIPATGTATAPAGFNRSRFHIEWPKTKEEERKWQLEQMAGAFRVFARLGFADGGSGHISLRDPIHPETFWINPYGIHFALLTVSHMVHIDKDGNRLGGADLPINRAGFTIHSALHQRRPDINAACHVHSPHGRAWSNFGLPIDMLNQDSCMFYNDLAVYPSFGGVVFAPEEGQHIADALGPTNKNLIMQNHGLLCCGLTVGEAAGFFIALERACQTQLLTEAAVAGGRVKRTFVGEEEAEYTKRGTGSPEVMWWQFEPEYQLVLKESRGDFLV